MLLKGIMIGILITIFLPVLLVVLGAIGITLAALWTVFKYFLIVVLPFMLIGILIGYVCGKNKKE